MTLRNLTAIGVFLFGTTYLWLTPAMAGKADGSMLKGGLWTSVEILAYVSVLVFAVASWAIYKSFDWWALATGGAAVVGIAATVAYVLAVRGVHDVANAASNIAIHAAGSLFVLAAVALPSIRDGIGHRL